MFHEACVLGGFTKIQLLDEAKVQMFVSQCYIV